MMLAATAALSVLVASAAHAVCASPVGGEGQIRYDASSKTVTVCDGTVWKTMGGVPTYTRVSNNFTLAALGEQVKSVSCPSGQTVVGGGCSTSASVALLSINDSYPSGASSWSCRSSALSLGVVMTVYAICAS